MNSKITISKDGEVLCMYSKDAEGTATIPEGIVAIRQYAFKNCKRITSVKFPTTLKKIGSNAFEGCSSLKSIQLPNGIEYIGKNAFINCHSMESAVIPPSISDLPSGMFEDCLSLKYVNLPESGLKQINDHCFKNCLRLRKIVIPCSVFFVGKAFIGCYNLKKVIVRSEKVEINKTAFVDCADGLTIDCVTTVKHFFKEFNKNHEFKPSSRIIKREKFANRLTSPLKLTLPNWIETIEEGAFRNCIGIEDIGIPESVETILANAFCGCRNLEKITFSEGIKVIGRNAFKNCERLTMLHMPDSLEEIRDYAFIGCKSLKEICLSQRTRVAKNAFDTNHVKISYR